ncbi:MAG: hypothetical protein H7Y86_02000 [Rhizobacter sp.]|nr:hypothetical protein [Ferruginibacter sp.]
MPNLTSDSVYGIDRTDSEIAQVIRYELHANGNAWLNFMNFHNMSDEDLAAMIYYLRAQKPVANATAVNEYGMIGKAVKAFMVKPLGPALPLQKTVKQDSTSQ